MFSSSPESILIDNSAFLKRIFAKASRDGASNAVIIFSAEVFPDPFSPAMKFTESLNLTLKLI
jgi:hypothetical protein